MTPLSRPTERFSDRVENYKKFRPTYPAEVIQHLESFFPDRRPLRIADIGAGTGIFTRLLLEAGHEVWAVEPNDEMRFAAEKDLVQFPAFHVLKGTSEKTELPTEEFDLITAAQAFHWFERKPTRREFHRLLKPEGRVALIWNTRQVATPIEAAYEKFLRANSTDYSQVRDQTQKTMTHLPEFFDSRTFQHRVFNNFQEFTLDSLWGRFLSSSYSPKPGTPKFDLAHGDLRELFTLHAQDNKVRINYLTDVYSGRC